MSAGSPRGPPAPGWLRCRCWLARHPLTVQKTVASLQNRVVCRAVLAHQQMLQVRGLAAVGPQQSRLLTSRRRGNQLGQCSDFWRIRCRRGRRVIQAAGRGEGWRGSLCGGGLAAQCLHATTPQKARKLEQQASSRGFCAAARRRNSSMHRLCGVDQNCLPNPQLGTVPRSGFSAARYEAEVRRTWGKSQSKRRNATEAAAATTTMTMW